MSYKDGHATQARALLWSKSEPARRRELDFEKHQKPPLETSCLEDARRAGESALDLKNGHAAQARARSHRAQARAFVGPKVAPRAGESSISKKLEKLTP